MFCLDMGSVSKKFCLIFLLCMHAVPTQTIPPKDARIIAGACFLSCFLQPITLDGSTFLEASLARVFKYRTVRPTNFRKDPKAWLGSAAAGVFFWSVVLLYCSKIYAA